MSRALPPETKYRDLMPMKTFLRYALAAVILFAAFAWLNNTSLFSTQRSGAPVLLAHRGLAQTFTREDLDRDTCTATRINPPEHAYIENTLVSMEAAFNAGADVVEFDVQPTTDGNFAVFHDWTLDCRTEGKGKTRDHTLAELKALDVGYGYSADGGKTFPFRGKGVGLMPSLDEVLTAFPDKRFLIDIKSNDASEGTQLAAYLAKLTPQSRARLMVYGGTPPLDAVHAALPSIPIGSNKSLKGCLIRYLLLGWSGHMPDACRQGMMLVPLNVTRWLWGWPDKFLQRMDDAAVRVFVLGPYDGSYGSSGVDNTDQLRELPDNFSGGIWTNRIDRIGAALGKSK
jgi:glycerophosphoryl diester phosphodiesterase